MEQSLGATSGRLCIMYQFVGLFNVHMSWFECFERFEFSFWFMMLCFIRMFRSEFCSSNVLCYFVFTFPSVTLWRCFNFIQFSLEFSFLCCWVYLYLFFGLCLFPVSPVRVCHVLCVFFPSHVCVWSRSLRVSSPITVSMFPSLCVLPLSPQLSCVHLRSFLQLRLLAPCSHIQVLCSVFCV